MKYDSKFIEQILDLTDYATEERKARRKRSKGHDNELKGAKSTQEFFTPYEIVKKMAEKVPEEYWSDPTKTFCEPCFGSGQFVLYIIWNRIRHGIDWKTALETTYGVELMQDNVYETHGRIFKMLSAMGIDFDDDVAFDIMLKNLVCSDFFEWDFENWCSKK